MFPYFEEYINLNLFYFFIPILLIGIIYLFYSKSNIHKSNNKSNNNKSYNNETYEEVDNPILDMNNHD